MKFGYLSVNAASGIHPGALGRELESRHFESLWVPEHSHIPVSSAGDYPAGGDLPDGYAHALSPFVSLMAAASVTTKLKLGTGVCLPLEHELMDLACTTATLDTLSEGRFIMGAGVGWNAAELNNARPNIPFKQRYSALRERIRALRCAWSESPADYNGVYADTDWGRQVSQFQGEFDQFTASWCFPKPCSGHIPVALGMSGPLGLRHVVEYADIWLPVDIALRNSQGDIDVAMHVQEFRRQLEAAGKATDAVAITLFAWSDLGEADIDQFRELGIERVVFGPPSFYRHDTDTTLRRLDTLAAFVEGFAAN